MGMCLVSAPMEHSVYTKGFGRQWNSIYVASTARGKGVGRALLAALIDSARSQGKKVIVAAVDSENKASLFLHRAMGFVETGRMPRIGEKWGKRRTMVLLQRELAERTGD